MTILVDRASEAIVEASPTLSAADQVRIEEDGWVAPAAIRQRQLAHALVNRFDEISRPERMAVLRLVEHFISHGTEAEHTAVATGFLEALLCAGDQGFDLDLVWSDLGPGSQAYCRAWNDYCGIENTR